MDKVDQFESAFRSAAKERFRYKRPAVAKVLVVVDRDGDEARHFLSRTRGFLGGCLQDSDWQLITGSEYATVGDLLALVEKHKPDLVCTYRHLQSAGWQWPFGLGTNLDVLTQATSSPVLVLPHPERTEVPRTGTNVVMAITDHLTGDHRLVNWGARFVSPGGSLWLTHVEDEHEFEREIGVISKIPEIDTDVAREKIRAQLLKEPRDYISSCRAVLAENKLGIKVEESVTFGHRLNEYQRLVAAHAVDLLVMNTKDDDQFAMHGLAYPLAVELRDLPLLML